VTSDPLRDLRPLIDRVYAYVSYRLGTGPDAEDVTSEVFERAVRYRASFDPDKGEPAAWLIGIARRCIDDRRRAIANDLGDPHLTEGTSDDLDRDVVGRLTLREALEQLDDRSREILALRYTADLTARDIGELLGMRTNTVEVAVHRSLERLRALLESPEPPRRDASAESYPKAKS
jgi:RNA polymerase sigma-70 factor (ECF subfamily)